MCAWDAAQGSGSDPAGDRLLPWLHPPAMEPSNLLLVLYYSFSLQLFLTS